MNIIKFEKKKKIAIQIELRKLGKNTHVVKDNKTTATEYSACK